MKRFNLTVTRLSGYTVDAESAEEAVDLVLGGEVEENGEETVDHTVEESAEQPDHPGKSDPCPTCIRKHLVDKCGDCPHRKQQSEPDPAKLAKLRKLLTESYEVFENALKCDLNRVGISKDKIEDIVTRLMEEADLETLIKVTSENF